MRWQSRDPVAADVGAESALRETGGDVNIYGAFQNNAVSGIDFLGLLTFKKNVCWGCDGGPHGETPAAICGGIGLPATGTFVPGASGSYRHRCWSTKKVHSWAMCNTESHIYIYAKNTSCCDKWRITCTWTYATSGKSTAARGTVKISACVNNSRFLGNNIYPTPVAACAANAGVGPTPGTAPYYASVRIGPKTETGAISIPPGGSWQEIFILKPSIRVNYKKTYLIEQADVSCGAVCIGSGAKP